MEFVDILPQKFKIDDVPELVPNNDIDDIIIYSHMMIHDAIHYITEYNFDHGDELEVAKIEIHYDIGAYYYRKNDHAYEILLNQELQDPQILKECTLPKILDVARELIICLNEYELNNGQI